MSSPDDQRAPGMAREEARDARREARRDQRSARRELMHGWAGPSIGGIVLVVLGLVLLGQNFGLQVPGRWWALLLLIPAVGSLVAAIRVYRTGDSGSEALLGIIAAAIFAALSLALFFGVDWGVFWPLLLVLVGGGLIFRSWQRGGHSGE